MDVKVIKASDEPVIRDRKFEETHLNLIGKEWRLMLG